MEYVMPFKDRRPAAKQRVRINKSAWADVLKRCGSACEWSEAGEICGLKNGDIDPIGGGTVRLQADHKSPHSINADTDPDDPEAWQALCGRHQVVKKNFWNNTTGKLNVYAIVQAAPLTVKREIFEFLKEFFGE
jgi:hypothetical protein